MCQHDYCYLSSLSAFLQPLVHLLYFIQLWEIERTNANNNSRAKKYTWNMNCVNVIVSWPVKNPLTIAQGWMQELKTHTRIVIKTSKSTAKIPGFVILNSIILVCLDRRHRRVDQPLLVQFHNDVASEGRNTVSGNCWLKYQGSCKKAEKYTTVIVVLLLWNIFGGVCSEQPPICIYAVVNFL